MVTLKCIQDDCVSQDIEFNFLGNPETAICGGCKGTLTATDLRDDPENLQLSNELENVKK